MCEKLKINSKSNSRASRLLQEPGPTAGGETKKFPFPLPETTYPLNGNTSKEFFKKEQDANVSTEWKAN